jgi:hypothetical protein
MSMQSQKLTQADEASTAGWLGPASAWASAIGGDPSCCPLEASPADCVTVASSPGLVLDPGLEVALASPPGGTGGVEDEALGAEDEADEHAAEAQGSIVAKANRRRMGCHRYMKPVAGEARRGHDRPEPGGS